jgi:hypothetical protein
MMTTRHATRIPGDFSTVLQVDQGVMRYSVVNSTVLQYGRYGTQLGSVADP